MKFAAINPNDIVNSEGICVSFWVQGCNKQPKCAGCHNPEQWSFEGGQEFTPKTLEELKKAISANGIQRSLSLLGGEPLCPENLFLTTLVIREIKQVYPNIKIYIWSGYTLEELEKISNPHLKYILETADYLIDGPYIAEQRDITLHLKGSKNQNVWDLKQHKIIG